MKNAAEMRNLTNNYANEKATKRALKAQDWLFKVGDKINKRAKKGYSDIKIRIPKNISIVFVIDELTDRGYKVIRENTYCRIAW
jgi:uncharacterized FlaG/YvyC family protein